MEPENKIVYPFDYEELGPEEMEEMHNCFTKVFTKVIRLGANGYLFYKEFDSVILDIYNMPLRTSDTFVVTFPRSGTTWTQDLVWLLQNDCDFENAKATPLTLRFPFIESGAFMKTNLPPELLQFGDLKKFTDENILMDPKLLNTMASPRFLKSHLPISLLPPSLLDVSKVVYVARDPRDVVVSNYFHMKSALLLQEDKEFKVFWNMFLKNKVLWCPYFEHVKEAWNQRNHPNMTFIFYEELSRDLPAVARRLAAFFGKEYSEEQYQALSDHLKFDNFKNNSSVNLQSWQDAKLLSGTFIRKGKSGGWREHFDAEMTEQAERWIADNLRDTDLRFPDVQ